MDLSRLNPWNWFKHEEPGTSSDTVIPVTRAANEATMPTQAGTASGSSFPSLFSNDFDRLFGELLRYPARMRWPESTQGLDFKPTMNVSSDDDGYLISIETPGMKRDDIGVELKGDRLIIRGEKREESEDKDRYFYRIERSYGAFQRVLSLPDDADADSLNAKLENGVLQIKLRRSESASDSSRVISVD